jgi:hypothetical protein
VANADSFSLEAYARVAAELVASGRARAVVLASHGLTDEAWMQLEAIHTRAIATDAMGEGGGASATFAEAYARAIEVLPLPAMSLDAWRSLRDDVALRGARALVDRGVSSATFVRLSQQFAKTENA